ncbi:phosphatidylglycerophosphatase A family protein [Pontibaca salina]|uniref:Phosphatidylglycerophosphatase A n=1 Tax=Pontibaca salina TaxID=2795731 RepID=A0A934M0V3_9RHOB|nr:phosphatidylglycerophosphatase A [Pontibaca salina]MBI6629036.1 phosphatidylglycerophosphatase A [Pontibaca salina]
MALARQIATLGGIGHLRPAPGTWGSLATLPLAWLFHAFGGFPLLVVATVAVILQGWWAVGVATRDNANKDPSEIVIDEVAGQMIALFPLSYVAWSQGIEITALWPGWIASFLLFRLFDIVKPGPVGWADRQGGPLGVMLDDIIAGIFAGIGVMILAGLWHGMMG